MSLLDILDRPIAFHRVFVDITNDFAAAGFLSQAIYWQRIVGEGEWFYKTRDEWYAEIGMKRSEQETSRKILVKLGVLHEERRGVPAKLHFLVDIQRLEDLLFSADKLAGKSPTGRLESNQLAGEKPANSMAGKSPTIKGALDYTETTQKNTRKKSSGVTLKEWLDEIVESGEAAIPDGDPIFEYAKKSNIPIEFLHLGWLEFKRRYIENSKTYVDWRAVFRNAIRGDWLKLWRFDADKVCYLSTAGQQAQMVFAAEREAA